MSNWKSAILVASSNGTTAITDPALAADALLICALFEAAPKFDARTDSFAAGKGDTCRDIGRKATQYGFASAKQREFAVKLVAWSKPRVVAAPELGEKISPNFSSGSALPVPKLFAVMQKHATLHAGSLKISRKNQDSLCWLVWNDRVVGKLENDMATVWRGKAGADHDAILVLLAEFDADPLAAAMKYGKLSGRCCSCGRDLTDPVSIERGIGPICAEKF